MSPGDHFSESFFAFLLELEANNNRGWFKENKARYEEQVREPALDFIRQMRPRLEVLSEHFLASDKKNGGSLLRIHRDMRFARDQAPYKTQVGIQFRHRDGKDIHAPGFYVQLEPGGSFLGVGTWRPPSKELQMIRAAIDREPKRWAAITSNPHFRTRFDREGESLKRVPRGYPKDHPLAEDLKRKSHIAIHRFEDDVATGPGWLDTVYETFRCATPYTQFLCEATGAPF